MPEINDGQLSVREPSLYAGFSHSLQRPPDCGSILEWYRPQSRRISPDLRSQCEAYYLAEIARMPGLRQLPRTTFAYEGLCRAGDLPIVLRPTLPM